MTLPAIASHSPADILGFWFEDISPSDHFNASPELDARISERFGTLVEALEAAGYPHVWEGTPEGALALVIALDQFPRNMFRGEAGAFLNDTLALDVAMRLVGQGHGEHIPPARRQFAYMPMMHAEDAAVQDRSVELFEALASIHPPARNNLRHAKAHREVVRMFGRFPGRNAALGRESTAEERAYLDGRGYGKLLERFAE